MNLLVVTKKRNRRKSIRPSKRLWKPRRIRNNHLRRSANTVVIAVVITVRLMMITAITTITMDLIMKMRMILMQTTLRI